MASTMFVLLAFLLGTVAVASSYPIVLNLGASAQLQPFAQESSQELQNNEQTRAYAANGVCDIIYNQCRDLYGLGFFYCVGVYVECVTR